MVAGVRGAGRGGSELRLRVKTMTTATDAHAILNGIDVPPGGHLCDRIWSVRDRIMLRPEGDDTADLVGEINERCDRAGVPEGKPGERVEWLAAELHAARVAANYWEEKCDKEREQSKRLETELSAVRVERDAAYADIRAAESALSREAVNRENLDRIIGKCHESCLECNVPTGRIDDRVRWLAYRLKEVKADLEAERAQLAGATGEFVCAASLDEVRAAVETLVSRVDGSTESADRLAVLVLGRAFGVLVEELADA